jgi:hypothetical protein
LGTVNVNEWEIDWRKCGTDLDPLIIDLNVGLNFTRRLFKDADAQFDWHFNNVSQLYFRYLNDDWSTDCDILHKSIHKNVRSCNIIIDVETTIWRDSFIVCVEIAVDVSSKQSFHHTWISLIELVELISH